LNYTRRKPIRSFVRRGRITASQKQVLDIATNPYLIKSLGTPFDFNVLEIGFGMGHALIAQAQQNPEKNYLGIDVHEPGIRAVLLAIKKYNLTNIRLMCADAVEILKNNMPANSLDTVQIFFPDPWPKRRHHKRRLIQVDFIQLLVDKLKMGGKLYLATDWEDYAQHMLKVMSMVKELKNMAGENQFSPRPQERPLTKFELRGQRLGHRVFDLVFSLRHCEGERSEPEAI